MKMTADEAIQRLGQLKSKRSNFDSEWQRAADVMNPLGGDFNTKHSPGERKTEHMDESTAANSLEKFTAAMEAFHTPRNQVWHRVRASDESLNKLPAVRDFFEEADRVLVKLRNSPKARFYGQAYEFWKSLGLTGNGCLFVDEAPKGGIRYRYTHVGNAWIETNFEGVVDTVYYEYELTARAAVQKWGEKAPKTAHEMNDGQPLGIVRFVHLVRPNEDKDPSAKAATGKEFESLEISLDDQTVIERGGYDELPYMWSRYSVNPSEMYGRGPAAQVIGDVLKLQAMQRTFLRAGHKVADPPLLAANDNQLGRGSKKIRLNPGGVTHGGLDREGKALIAPLVSGGRIDMTEMMMDRFRENIREAFLNSYFDILVQDRTQMTAYEVAERSKEKGQLLAPVIGRQQSEFLGPLVSREIGIAQRQGLLGELPGELIEADGEYDIEYESDATRMQRADEVSAFVRWQQVMEPFIAKDPGILDVVDAEKAAEHYGRDLGVPSKLFRTESELEEINAAKQQQVQGQQMMEGLPAMAKAARDLSGPKAA